MNLAFCSQSAIQENMFLSLKKWFGLLVVLFSATVAVPLTSEAKPAKAPTATKEPIGKKEEKEEDVLLTQQQVTERNADRLSPKDPKNFKALLTTIGEFDKTHPNDSLVEEKEEGGPKEVSPSDPKPDTKIWVFEWDSEGAIPEQLANQLGHDSASTLPSQGQQQTIQHTHIIRCFDAHTGNFLYESLSYTNETQWRKSPAPKKLGKRPTGIIHL